MSEIKPNPPQVDSSLRHLLRLPASCYQASGIVVNGRRIKSLVFAVYPFTLQSAISHALINGSYIPVFCGCGGAADSRSRAENPRGVPRGSHHCERRKRHHLYAAFHCRTLKTHDGKVPRKRNDFHLDSKLDKLSSLFYTGLVVFRAG